MIFVIIATLAILAYPFMSLVKTFQQNSVDSRRDNAEVAGDETTYGMMKEQIERMALDIQSLVAEKNRYFETATKLEAEVALLRKDTELIGLLKARLDEKDAIISSKDRAISDMTERIMLMQDRIHALEMRLAKDERMMGQSPDTTDPALMTRRVTDTAALPLLTTAKD